MRAKLAALAAALRRLPQQQLDVIVMLYYDKLTVQEIAWKMAITPEAVDALRQAAEAELERALFGDLEDLPEK